MRAIKHAFVELCAILTALIFRLLAYAWAA